MLAAALIAAIVQLISQDWHTTVAFVLGGALVLGMLWGEVVRNA